MMNYRGNYFHVKRARKRNGFYVPVLSLVERRSASAAIEAVTTSGYLRDNTKKQVYELEERDKEHELV